MSDIVSHMERRAAGFEARGDRIFNGSIIAEELRWWIPKIAAATAGGWQPIETAPKDQTIIITGRYANGRAYVEEGYWHPHGHFNARKFDPPTHWMPMPHPFGGWDTNDAENIQYRGER